MFRFLKTLTDQKRIKILKISTAIFMCLGFLMTIKVWALTHNFPVIKIFTWISEMPPTITLICVYFIFTLLIISIFKPKKPLYLGVLLLTILLLMQDYMRWQPWEYMYGLMLIVFLFEDKNDNQKTLFALKLILSGAYFWAGVHKLNPYFINTFPLQLATEITEILSIESVSIIYKISYLGYLVPLIEIAIGIGLWLKKYRKLAVIAAVITHIIVLIFQAPAGINAFGVVYPWNIAMVIFVILLFYRDNEELLIKIHVKSKLSLAVILLVWVMPVFNIFGLWHNYASFKLYTGNDTYIFAVINNDDLDAIQPNLKPYVFDSYPQLNEQFEISKNQSIISFYHWSIDELKIPFNLNHTTIRQTLNYMHTFDSERQYPISFLIYKNGVYQKLIENDYLND